MKKFGQWLRANAAVIAGASVIAGAISPAVKDTIKSVKEVAAVLAESGGVH